MANKLWNSISLPKIDSNRFDLTHDVKMSLKMGYLYPVMTLPCLPGDRFTIGAESLIRFAPLITPVMHRMDVTIHYFFVANRLLWPGFKTWITGDVSAGGMPTCTVNNASTVRDLPNYLGIPVSTVVNQQVTALPFAAYQMIYNEYYRDQNLIPEVPYELVQGDNTFNTDLLTLRKRAWEHDYFTSALPTAQAGAPVDVPLGDVRLKNQWASTGTTDPYFVDQNNSPVIATGIGQGQGGTVPHPQIGISGPGSAQPIALDPNGSLELQPTTVNELRRAYKLQEYLERLARGGRRMTEFIKSMWDVNSSDARLQRPEYITGVKSPVIISEVLNTSGSAAPQGTMAGHGVSVVGGQSGSYYCEEYGYIMGIMSVTPKTAYQQGIPKDFLKLDPMDFGNPIFANLGEQPILNKELYVDHSNPNGEFGYVPRFSEYKFMPNRTAGDFQTILEDWHLTRTFATEPNLNQSFIECTPSRRIFAVTDPTEDIIYAQILNKVSAVRKLPVYGTPSMF